MKQSSRWAILSGVVLAILLSSLDQTIVATAMPTIVQELHGLEHFSWVFTAYMLGSTITVPIYGKLSDIFGRRNLYLIGIGIFLSGSILCGLAQDMAQLIFFRAIQGIGGGAMMVNSYAIIGEIFPPAERGKYQGMIGGVFGLSSIGGPLRSSKMPLAEEAGILLDDELGQNDEEHMQERQTKNANTRVIPTFKR